MAEVKLRRVTFDDAELLFLWRNDPQTRTNSLNTSKVIYEDHVRWLKWNLGDPFVTFHIGVWEGIDIGVVRTEEENTGHWMSWTIAPERRGQGLGYRLVKAVADITPGRLKASIKRDNTASIRIAERVGFILESEKDGVCHYALTPDRYVPDPLNVLRHL